MKKLIKPFLLILVCTVVVFLFSMIYGYFQEIPSGVTLLDKDVSSYRIQTGILLFCKLLFATLATGTAMGFSWAFATEADPKKHRSAAFMLPQLKNVLIVITACTVLFIIAVDLIQPAAESKQNAMVQDEINFREYTQLAKEYEAKKEYVTAYFYAEEASKLNPDDSVAAHYATEMEKAIVSMDIYTESMNEDKVEEELRTAFEYLSLAQEAYEGNDYFNAHFYAVRAEEISPRDDETVKKARELAASAWNRMSTYSEGVALETEELYFAKKAAYDYLAKGDTLQAYYAFRNLSEKYPKDGDIQKYYEAAKNSLEASYFYTDDTNDIRALENYNNVSFTLENQIGGKNIYNIRGITVVSNTGQLVQYLRDLRVAKTDANGKILSIFSVPYAKMSAQADADDQAESSDDRVQYKPFLLLESVNSNADIERLHIKPEWVIAEDAELPSYLLLDMPYDDFTLIRQASSGPELMPLVSLFRFVSIADKYGFSEASYRATLILRLSLPLFILALLLYMAVIGWGLRMEPDQPFKTRWILMYPLFASVTYIAKDLMLYVLRLLVFVLCDFNPALALYEVIIAALVTLLLTSIYFLNLQSE